MKKKKQKKARKTGNGLRRMNAWMGLFLFLIVAATAATARLYAAQITNRTDHTSDQTLSAPANHTIAFNLSGGNTFATGEQVAVAFPSVSAFTTSGTWATADFTFNDGTVRAIAGVNEGPGVSTVVCLDGANNLGIAIDTTGLVFRAIPCGASFAASAPGAYISFNIQGTAPNGLLLNPAAAGSYSIRILNGAGDCQLSSDICDIGVAMISSNVTVTASVNATIPSGGGGGGGAPDTTPPVISNIHTQNPTTTSIDVCWDTNEVADSTVNYGATNTYGSQQVVGSYVATRCITLNSLTQGTTYHYQVCSKDPSNNLACSTDQTFLFADTTPPVISGVSVTAISCTNATVGWTTDKLSTSYVDYGTPVGPPYGSTTGSATLVTSHTVTVTGLIAGTTYHYRARSGDASANESFTGDQSFITQTGCVPDVTPPVISNILVTLITSSSAHVCWDTNELADGKLDYGMTVAYGQTQNDSTFNMTRCFDLTGLNANNTYHYKLTSKDASSNSASTADLTFMTLAGLPGTCNVDCSATVINPYIINPDGTVHKAGTAWVHVTNLSPGIDRYNFEDQSITPGDPSADWNDVIVTVDHRDCTATTFTAMPTIAVLSHVIRAEIFYHGILHEDVMLWPDSHTAPSNPLTMNFGHDVNICNGQPPNITNVRALNVTQTSALISWDTLGTLTDSTVDYGLSLAYGLTKNVVEAVTNHTVSLAALTKGTLYHYRVESKDSGNQNVISADFTFSTLPDTTPPANVSGLTATPGDARVTLNWTNPTDLDFVGVKVLRKTTAYPTGPTNGTLVYQGNAKTFADLGVTNGVTYYYAVFAYDDVPNYSSGAVVNATPAGLPDTTPPGLVTGLTATPGDARVQLNWTNPGDVDFVGVKMLRKVGSYPANSTDGTLAYQGNLNNYLDTGVSNGTHYFYSIFTYDAVPNYSAGAQVEATPSAVDITPPGPVTNFSATAGDSQVALSWTNPGDADWAGTRVVRTVGHGPASQNDGVIVWDGVGSYKMDNGVVNGTKYYYGAFSYDASLNYAAGAFADATPNASLPPLHGPACSDSDGGKNYFMQGRVTFGANETSDDFCVDATTLMEQYCDSNNVHQSESHDCGGGFKCTAGKCEPSNTPPSTEICGNGTCAGNENSVNCPADCPVVPPVPPIVIPPPTVSAEAKTQPSDLRFYATAGKIQLRLENDNVLNFYGSSVFTVMIPDPAIHKPIATAFVNFNGAGYVMKQTASYEATVVTPAQVGDYPLDVVINYQDGTKDSVHVAVHLSSRPRVYEDVSGKPSIAGARVTLLSDHGGGNFGLWDGKNFGEENPQVTDKNGRFGFILPAGSYQLVVEKDGYLTNTTLAFPITTENAVLTDVPLIKLPPKNDVAANVNFAAKVAAATVKEVIGNAYVKQNAQNIAAPAATIATVANVAAAGAATATVIPYLLYLWSLLAHPFMLIARRKRKQWGVIYNSLSKLPIDLAIVRLLDAQTGRIIRSSVTDKEGRYFFIVQPGSYKMVAVKAGLVFPSDLLHGLKEDAKYADLYHGEVIVVRKETTITANIPLDPIGAEKTPRKIVLEGIGRRFQKSLGIITVLAMGAATVITPTATMFAMLSANVVMYVIFRRLAVTRKPKNWGIVYDEKTKQPLPNVVTRIFETRFNKLLETQVTDARGRYAFLVGQNAYYVTFDKPGYEKQQKGPVALTDTKKQGLHVVAVDVKLQRAGGAPTEPKPAVESTGGPSAAAGLVAGHGPEAVPPSGFALRTAVKPLASTGAADVPASSTTSSSSVPVESYEAKMLARLKKMSSPQSAVSKGQGETVVDKQGSATHDASLETPAELLMDLRNEANGSQNGRLLPDAEHTPPEEPK